MENTSLSIVASSEAVHANEAPLAAMPPGVLEDPKAWEQWCKSLDAEHEAAERDVAQEFEVADHADRRLLSLRTRQVMAFQALIGGKSIAAAARAAGVNRATVHRWIKDDPNFKAALARQADEQMAAAREQLKNSVEPAARNIHQAVRQGHVAASMQVLKSVGLMGARAEAKGEPSPRAVVSSRAALALEARLGQLLSMLAKHPAIAGALENAGPGTDVENRGADKQLPTANAPAENPSVGQECRMSNAGDNCGEAKE
jgi:transposase-like protein